jgi:hypothetical protein
MQPSQRRSGSGDWLWKVSIGCGLALGLGLLVGIGLAIYGVYWLLSPGRQMPTALVVGPRSVGVVRLERGDTDAGMRELVQETMLAIQRAQLAAQEDRIPPFLRRIQSWQLGHSRNEMAAWMPREATLSIEAGPEGERESVVAAINMQRFVRPLGMVFGRMIKGEPGTRVEPHGEHELIVNPGGSAVSFAEGTLLFGSSAASLGAVLDRWDHGAGAALPAAVTDLAGRFDVYGTLDRPEDAQAWLGLFATLVFEGEHRDAAEAARLAIARVRSLRFGLDARNADEAQAFVELVYETPEAARDAEAGIAALLSEMQARAKANRASMAVRPSREGPRVRAEIGLTGIESAIQAWADNLMRRPGS